MIAAGGDLEPATVIAAYRCGLFPMVLEELGGALAWWSPDPRGILPLDHLRVTRSLRQSAKRYDVRVDTCFEEVIRACADPARESGWITPAFIDAYTMLHRLGWAHSVEVFDRSGRLAGGLYGVRVAGLFAGESMFYAQRDASKVALMALVGMMRADYRSGLTAAVQRGNPNLSPDEVRERVDQAVAYTDHDASAADVGSERLREAR